MRTLLSKKSKMCVSFIPVEKYIFQPHIFIHFLGRYTDTRTTFYVPSANEPEEAEEISVEHLLCDLKDSTTSLRGLALRLEDSDIRKCLADVAAGMMLVNHQIVYHLQDALNLFADLSDPDTTQSFVASKNDQLLVV
jgi:26S proteasome regulatory subunit N8